VTTRARGFSLMELLVAMCIIAALCGLLLPVLTSARERGKRSSCISNLRQIGCALHMYADDYDGLIYPAMYNEGWKCPMGRYPRGSAWPVALRAYTRNIAIFRCPNDDLLPRDMQFAWAGGSSDGDPSEIRVSYIYVGLNLWTGPDKPWQTDRWRECVRRIGPASEGEDSPDVAADKGWVVRDKDWWGPNGGWITVHDRSASDERPLNSGSNVLLLDGSARWHPYWDN